MERCKNFFLLSLNFSYRISWVYEIVRSLLVSVITNFIYKSYYLLAGSVPGNGNDNSAEGEEIPERKEKGWNRSLKLANSGSLKSTQ